MSTFNENNFQNNKVKILTIYYTLGLAILWFVNTTGCCKSLALAYFISNSFFIGQIAYFCYDNYMYNKWYQVDSGVPVLERYDMTAWHCQ